MLSLSRDNSVRKTIVIIDLKQLTYTYRIFLNCLDFDARPLCCLILISQPTGYTKKNLFLLSILKTYSTAKKHQHTTYLPYTDLYCRSSEYQINPSISMIIDLPLHTNKLLIKHSYMPHTVPPSLPCCLSEFINEARELELSVQASPSQLHQHTPEGT